MTLSEQIAASLSDYVEKMGEDDLNIKRFTHLIKHPAEMGFDEGLEIARLLGISLTLIPEMYLNVSDSTIIAKSFHLLDELDFMCDNMPEGLKHITSIHSMSLRGVLALWKLRGEGEYWEID